MSVLFYTHPVALRHDAGPGHPESPIRLQAILAAVDAAAIRAWSAEAPLATLEQIQRVHPARYTSRILAAVPRRAMSGSTPTRCSTRTRARRRCARPAPPAPRSTR